MLYSAKLRTLLVSATLISTLLAGCAGGGGGSGGGGGRDSSDSTGLGSCSAPPAGYPTLPCSLPTASGAYKTNPQLEQTNYRYAHEAGIKGSGVTVAVVDTGVAQHTKLGSRLRSGVDSVGGVLGGREDGVGHGTHVAGIIGASVEGAGLAGIAPDVQIAPIRVLDSAGTGTTADLYNGVVASGFLGAKIYNISLTSPPAQDFHDAITWIASNGKLAVVASGNDSRANPNFPGSAAADWDGSLLVVGAVDNNGVMAYYSNKAGIAKDYFLVAPGSAISSLHVDGVSSTVKSGTSMATPVVSGVAALVWGYWPYLTAKQVSDILLTTAKDLGAPGVDDVYGHGLVDAKAALSPIGQMVLTSQQGTKYAAGTPVIQSTGMSTTAIGESKASVVYLDAYRRGFKASLSSLAATAGASTLSQQTADYMPSRTVGAMTTRGPGATLKLSLTRDTNQPLDRPFDYRIEFASGSGVSTAFQGMQHLGLAQTGFEGGARQFASSSVTQNPYLGLASKPSGASYSLGLSDKSRLSVATLTGADALGSQLSTYVSEFAWKSKFADVSLQVGWVQGASAFAGMAAKQSSASSSFTSLAGALALSEKVRVQSMVTIGSSRLSGQDVLMAGQAKTQAFSLSLVRQDSFTADGVLGLGLALPNRVTSGTATLNLPTSMTEDGALVYEAIPLSMTPSGRERVLELSWSRSLSLGSVGLSIARRFEPNHDASAPGITTALVRYTSLF